ncbi:MAG: T9SS type A sorting domain-containing protein, partial [Pedobacter sp.]
DSNTTATATLYDVSGKVIYSNQVKLKEGKNEFDFNFNVPTGIMFLSIKNDKTNFGTSKIFFK